MATNGTDRNDRKAPDVSRGEVGSVLAAMWSEFFNRVFEAGARRTGDAVLQALNPAQSGQSSATGIESLVESYRPYLGEMANLLPAIGRYLAGQLKPGRRGAGKLLFRMIPDDVTHWRLSAERSQTTSVLTTDSTLEALTAELKTALKQDRVQLPELLDVLATTVDEDGLRDLPRVLDELKYEFKRRGPSALSDLRKELRALLAPEADQRYEVLDALKQALGENVVHKILKDQLLECYVDVARGKLAPIPSKAIEQLQSCFGSIGIQLSGRVSVVLGRHGGFILDHGKDVVYEVRYFERHYDVYGPSEGRHYRLPLQKPERDILLPARVIDASEGLAVWSVDRRIIDELLRRDRTNLETWEIGRGKTPVVLCAIDHREGDLGAYAEIILGCMVAPKDQPLAIGIWTLGDVPVTTEAAITASESIWGYRKVHQEIKVVYRDRSVTYELRGLQSGGDPLLELTLPRGGAASSMPLPLLSYTMKQGLPSILDSLNCTVISRSGTGEQVRGGGAGVFLSAPGFRSSSLCDMLRTLDLVDDKGQLQQQPLFSVWTEHMSAEAGPPSLVPIPTESS